MQQVGLASVEVEGGVGIEGGVGETGPHAGDDCRSQHEPPIGGGGVAGQPDTGHQGRHRDGPARAEASNDATGGDAGDLVSDQQSDE